jgi:DNA polymerase-3 subunit epsilon
MSLVRRKAVHKGSLACPAPRQIAYGCRFPDILTGTSATSGRSAALPGYCLTPDVPSVQQLHLTGGGSYATLARVVDSYDYSFALEQSLDRVTFAVVDVETTGLSPAYGHRVCEVACLRVRGGEVLDGFEALVNPRRAVSPGAFAVNGITREMLRGAPSFAEIAPALLDVTAEAVLVAHNAPFDLGFLAAEWEIARLPLPEHHAIDTLTLARRTYRFPRNSLVAVAAALGVPVSAAHRAMGDVETTFGVLQHVLRDLAQRRGVSTLGQLLDVQGGAISYPREQALPLPPAIAEALENGGLVHMRYVDARGNVTDRTVKPLRVSAERGNLYLVAHCFSRGEQRTFRLDRVVEMVLED